LLAAPVLDAIGTVSVPADKTRILPVTAFDADGDPLSYTVTSDGGPVSATLRTGNPYLKLSVADHGDLIFQLFEDLAPTTVATIRGLVERGFYNGLTFHRVVPSFVIQGGDPLGTGMGGPGFQFDDEFHPDAIFSGDGQLAMANSGKDTNGSQFFVTVGPQRFLDFNHTIWGQLVRGFDVLAAINAVPTTGPDPVQPPPPNPPIPAFRPLTPVVITTASIVENTTDAVLILRAGGAGSSSITVTVSDGKGGTDTKTFPANVVVDTTNDPPILGPVGNQTTVRSTPIAIPLSSIDLEGDPVTYAAALLDNPANGTVQVSGNVVTVTPNPGFVGEIRLLVGVRQTGATSRGSTADPFDKQALTITVREQVITAQAVEPAASEGIPLSDAVFARFTALGPAPIGHFTATIDWKDGTTSPGRLVPRPGGGYEVVASRTYPRSGDFPFDVIVTDTVSGGSARVSGMARVANVTPQVTAGTGINLSTGTGWSRDGSFTDPGAGPWTATVDYGDGTGERPLALNADRTFSLSHAYVDPGSYTVRVRVRDEVGGTGTASFQAIVEAPPPPPPPLPTPPLVRIVSAALIQNSRKAVTGLTLTLDGPIDEAGATEPANYRIVTSAGRDRKFGTPDDGLKRARRVSFDAATGTIRLVPAGPLNLRGRIELRVQGLRDRLGRPIDGDRNGQEGGEFVALLTKRGVVPMV
jgi:cyclophilin family peptidyl-prolyl cis-trans isomerase